MALAQHIIYLFGQCCGLLAIVLLMQGCADGDGSVLGDPTLVDFIVGKVSSDTCPSGYTQILSESLCRAALADLEIHWSTQHGNPTAWFDSPKGCLRGDGDQGFFNTHRSGSAHGSRAPICGKALHGYTLRGDGHCRDGLYARSDADDAKSVATCAAKCASEPKCKYFSLNQGVSCSRYNIDAGLCVDLVPNLEGPPNHVTYKKEVQECTTDSECTTGMECGANVNVGICRGPANANVNGVELAFVGCYSLKYPFGEGVPYGGDGGSLTGGVNAAQSNGYHYVAIANLGAPRNGHRYVSANAPTGAADLAVSACDKGCDTGPGPCGCAEGFNECATSRAWAVWRIFQPKKVCTVSGPSAGVRQVASGDEASQVLFGDSGWKFDTVDACRNKCAEITDCSAYHWYGAADKAFKDCYLHKSGVIVEGLDDGRDRYAGTCETQGM